MQESQILSSSVPQLLLISHLDKCFLGTLGSDYCQMPQEFCTHAISHSLSVMSIPGMVICSIGNASLKQALYACVGGKTLSKTFSRRIIWRDLAYWQLHHWPHMAAKPIRQHYKGQVCQPVVAGGTQRQQRKLGTTSVSRLHHSLYIPARIRQVS